MLQGNSEMSAPDLQNRIEQMKKDNPDLVELIKSVIAESLNVSMSMDTSYEGDRQYVTANLDISIGDDVIHSGHYSANL